MRRELLFFSVSLVLSLLIAAFVLSKLEPRLFGLPADLKVVKLNKKQPAFFNSVFRPEDLQATDLLLNDPILLHRGKPLLSELEGVGPHDLLGFRNWSVPALADLVVIGDSQTYGNNALISQSWPMLLEKAIQNKDIKVYSMAVGGWSALQYLEIFNKAIAFKPSHVVIAFYAGNDALEAFRTAYAIDYWRQFRLDKSLSIKDLPPVRFPVPDSEFWKARFSDGTQVFFTPRLRFEANDLQSVVVQTGYQIIYKTISELVPMAKKQSIKLFFTMIPTKELVYAEKIESIESAVPKEYKALVAAESMQHEKLANFTKEQGSTYINLLHALREALERGEHIYPHTANGHPLPEGYKVIADTVYEVLREQFSALEDGFYKVKVSKKKYWWYELKAGRLYQYPTEKALKDKGADPLKIKVVSYRKIARYPLEGYLGSNALVN